MMEDGEKSKIQNNPKYRMYNESCITFIKISMNIKLFLDLTTK